MTASGQNRTAAGIAAALAVVTVAVFWPAQHYEFVNLDDPAYVSDSPVVRAGLSWSGVQWSFQGMDPCAGNPLTTMSYLLDSQLFGVKAAAFHRTNVLLHTVNAVLFFLVLRRMTRAPWPSAGVAALFAWHPLHVEAVAWISARKDLLSAFFLLLALWAYTRYAQLQAGELVSKRWNGKLLGRALSHFSTFYFLSLALFALGLLAKSSILGLPFLLLLLDYWPLRRSQRLTRLLLEKLPFALLGLIAGSWAFVVQRQGGAIPTLSALPLGDRLGNAMVSYVRYLGKLFWPVDLAVFYPHPGHWPAWQVTGAAVLLAVMTLMLLFFIRRQPYLAVGWFWFLGMLVPVIGVVQIGTHSMADRYTYLPLNGLFVMLVWGAHEFAARWPTMRRWLGMLALAAAAACCVLSRLELEHWRNSELLMEHARRVTRNNYLAHNNLGIELQRQGRLDAAASCFIAALECNPAYDEGLNNLGTVRERQGMPEEARGYYRAALQMNPNNAEAHNNLGILLQRAGKLDDALNCYREALRCKPCLADAHFNLGILLEQQGKQDEAIESYREAVRHRPDHAEANNNLGALLQQQSRLDEAIGALSAAVRSKPDFAEARFNLGIVLERQGKLKQALDCYAQAIRFKPNFAEAHFNLAGLLARQGRTSEAVNHFREAVRLKPDWVEALNNLAWILATHPDARCRNGRQAVALASRAVELTRTNYPAALETLAAAYAEVGQFNNAIVTVKQAIRVAEASGSKKLAEELSGRMQFYENARLFFAPANR